MNVLTNDFFRHTGRHDAVDVMNSYYLKMRKDGDVYYLFLIG